MADEKLVESINGLSSAIFFAKYLPGSVRKTMTEVCHQHYLDVMYSSAIETPASILDACLALIQETSSAAYDASEKKWSTRGKRKEMLLLDMKYIILTYASHQPKSAKIAGFASFMLTYEDGLEVVYLYEVHLQSELRGKNIGTHLMAVVEEIARTIGVEKVMLTVFKTNDRAIRLYNSLGFSQDPFSPEPRRLRNGTVKEPSYVILSKPLCGTNR